MPTGDVPSSVIVPAPASVYLMALSKLIWPIVLAPSTVTVCGTVIFGPNSAVRPAALGALGDQLPSLVQFPSASTFQTLGTTVNLKLSKYMSAGAPPPALGWIASCSQPPPSVNVPDWMLL